MKHFLAILTLTLALCNAHGADVALGRYSDLTWTGTGADRVAVWSSGDADVTAGLIARWILSEGTGTTAADSIGTNTAYFVDSPVWTNRAAGKGGLRFDGINDTLRSSTVRLNSTNIITLAFWMNWLTYANNDDIAFEYGPNGNGQNAFAVNPNSSSPSGKFVVSMSGTGGRYNGLALDRPSSGTWRHYTLIANRTTGTNLGWTAYINGVLTNGVQATFSNLSNENFSATSFGLFMGSRSGNLYGNCALQDVRLYNRALSSNEAWSISRQ